MSTFISLSVPLPSTLTVANLPYTEKDSVLPWFLCSSQIINNLIVASVTEKILTLLLNILNKFGEISASENVAKYKLSIFMFLI